MLTRNQYIFRTITYVNQISKVGLQSSSYLLYISVSTYIYAHTHMHIYIYTYIHTYINTHTRTASPKHAFQFLKGHHFKGRNIWPNVPADLLLQKSDGRQKLFSGIRSTQKVNTFKKLTLKMGRLIQILHNITQYIKYQQLKQN